MLSYLNFQALQVITTALRRNGDNADLYYYQGNFYKDLNNMPLAKKVRPRNCFVSLQPISVQCVGPAGLNNMVRPS